MSLVAAWLWFPIVAGALALGCGLLVERAAGRPLPGTLIAPVGFATIVVASGFATWADWSAELATPLVVVLAVAGVVLARPWRAQRRPDRWASGVGVAVFAMYGLPVLLSGSATFVGYGQLDDASTWLAFIDHALDHGRDLAGLAPSTHEATLALNLGHGYPLGAFVPVGALQPLVGQDLAWIFQPYTSFVAAMLALALYELLRPVIERPPVRAGASFVAAQPALMYAYGIPAGAKEIVAAALLPLLAALAAPLVREEPRVRGALPLSVAVGAMVVSLSVGSGPWLLAMLLPVAALVVREAVRSGGWRRWLGMAALVAFGGALLALPALSDSSQFASVARGVLTRQTELGNLLAPLDLRQLFGVWPAGDFRRDPTVSLGVVTLFTVVVGGAAVAGAAWAARVRAWSLLLYGGGVLLGLIVLLWSGSPWVDGKALATASPAVMVFAVAAVGLLREVPAAAWALGAVLAFGVLWSNLAAIHDAPLAPRDRLAELEEIGERFAGAGPALLNEYEPYGARHFMRRLDTEAPSELRRRRIPLRGDRVLEKLQVADLDAFEVDDLYLYRTIVVRRSPIASRPPATYELKSTGRFYEVWQRPVEPSSRLLVHQPLGTNLAAPGIPRCSDVGNLVRQARAQNAHLEAVPERPPVIVLPTAGELPAGWTAAGTDPPTVVPSGSGRLELSFEVPSQGRYEVWFGGSFTRSVEISIDGQRVGAVGPGRSFDGQYEQAGEVTLSAGRHEAIIDYPGAGLSPGSGTDGQPFGPLGLRPAPRPLGPPERAERAELCRGSWDWIDVVSGP